MSVMHELSSAAKISERADLSNATGWVPVSAVSMPGIGFKRAAVRKPRLSSTSSHPYSESEASHVCV